VKKLTIAIDLAKNVFEIAVADSRGKIVDRRRVNRPQLQRYLGSQSDAHVVMESCSTAHFWGRWCLDRGLTVSLLPPLYVRAYVRRNKTDSADATALLEAARASDIHAVAVKSVEQQAIQGLHRIRSGWMATRTARINALRGHCREFGIAAPAGPRSSLASLVAHVDDPASAIPDLLRAMLRQLIEEIRGLEERVHAIEAHLAVLAGQSEVCQRLQTIPGIGLLTATAFAGTVGDIRSFRNARCFASWLGLTPREHSSGNIRRLGAISKRGDAYLRMMLIHGARAVLYSARMAERARRPLDALRGWGLRLLSRGNHNKAAVAIANKLARIVWAAWYRQRDFEFRADSIATT
jgi:transposase